MRDKNKNKGIKFFLSLGCILMLQTFAFSGQVKGVDKYPVEEEIEIYDIDQKAIKSGIEVTKENKEDISKIISIIKEKAKNKVSIIQDKYDNVYKKDGVTVIIDEGTDKKREFDALMDIAIDIVKDMDANIDKNKLISIFESVKFQK